MSRDIKIYLLIVVLPAMLLVAGGIRLVALERDRVRSMAVETLDAKATSLARQISEKLREKGCSCRDAKPPKPPHGEGRWRGWRFHGRNPGEGCRFHDLPPDVCAVIRETVNSHEETSSCVAEIRHGCGCTVLIAGENRIAGTIFGSAPLQPMLPSYSVCVAPAGGDAAVALDASAQAMLAAILVCLLFGTLAAGVILLVRAARRAKAEARAKTDFLSNVSHELKTPLTSIAMFAEMLENGSIGADAAKTACATISRESRRLGRMIDGLLEYARLDRGARKYEIAEFPLMPLLKDAVASFAHSFPAGISFSPDSKPDAVAVADRDATRRIIDCLLENAAKYAPGSPVELKIAIFDGGRVGICVSDHGSGIAEADAKHIFERFWRADNSVTRSTGGAGLGLAIARELAGGMGATLAFCTNSPSGAVFTLIFATENRRKT